MMEGGEAPSADAPPAVAVVHVGSHDLQGSDTVPGNQTEINALSTDIINECACESRVWGLTFGQHLLGSGRRQQHPICWTTSF